MEQVIGGSQKVIVDPGTSGSGVVPYLPLPALQGKPAGGADATSNTSTTTTTSGAN